MRFLNITLMLAITASSLGADFPAVADLPSKPELPDPLVMLNGERVTSKEQWVAKRRPELIALFQHYMYGVPPAAPDKVEAKILHEDRKAFDGKATLQEIALSYGPAETPKIYLLLAIPNERKGPAPVFVGMNFCGNQAIVKDAGIRLPTVWMYGGGDYPGIKDHKATEASRGTQVDTWAIEQSIARGYAVATFYNGDVDPDRADVREGIQSHFRKADAKPGPHDWGTIAAWVFGLQRVVDFLVADKDIDKTRIAVVGHSRLGKTALLAAALDERIALAIPLQAGCGGTAPSRTKDERNESVARINKGFPHWFNGTFKEFGDKTDRLPFDQHCLVALVAPRPVLFANAVEDLWANPEGQFQMLQAADPEYRLLGAGGLDAKKMPEVGTLVDSKLGYYIRPGKHSMTKGDWKVFLDYADKQFGKSGSVKCCE